ncbi:MAG: SDR family NAD(P)-dependent oxidoreductase [Verrucomicrobium sp.]|nr:SDR family NAD(P)-dependent oxidoreductase [Verrucomicrobium sp.]
MAKVIFLTGATRGLGRALAGAFATLGHTVAGCGRDQAKVAELAGELGAPHSVAGVDVGDDTQVSSWIRRALAEHGAPDLVLNNAALMNQPAPLWEVSAAEFEALTRVNVNGTANVIRHAVPAMLKAGKGVVANFSSGWGRSTSPEVAPYCATKWAIEGLTRALAQELQGCSKGVAAVAVNPGVIDTEMLRSCWGGGAGSYPSPEEWVKRAAPFLLDLGPKDNGKALSI